VIEVRAVTKRYGATVAVDHLTFTVHPGRVTGFLGPNGAGKTTTLRVILGLVAATAGESLVNDRPYRRLRRPLRQVGALLDANAVHGGRTARDHLRWVARSNGIPRIRVAEVLDIVGLGDVSSRRAGGFSLGMKQRLGIAAALLGDPEILILDEPVNGLDPDGIRWIRRLLKSLAAEGRTVFVSSHLMSEMSLMADHLIVIGRGRLIADTSLAEFVRLGTSSEVVVRSARGADLAGLLTAHGARVAADADGALVVTGLEAAAIGQLAAAHGIPLHELMRRGASLEEVFVAVTHDNADHRAESSARA
jgi:ABC-2 type transport system ATP-binding protein